MKFHLLIKPVGKEQNYFPLIKKTVFFCLQMVLQYYFKIYVDLLSIKKLGAKAAQNVLSPDSNFS